MQWGNAASLCDPDTHACFPAPLLLCLPPQPGQCVKLCRRVNAPTMMHISTCSGSSLSVRHRTPMRPMRPSPAHTCRSALHCPHAPCITCTIALHSASRCPCALYTPRTTVHLMCPMHYHASHAPPCTPCTCILLHAPCNPSLSLHTMHSIPPHMIRTPHAPREPHSALRRPSHPMRSMRHAV